MLSITETLPPYFVYICLIVIPFSIYFAGLMTKLAVFTGERMDQAALVFNLEDPNSVCKNLADIPAGMEGASGVLFNGEPIYCGSVTFSDKCDCYKYDKTSGWLPIPTLQYCRTYSGHAKLGHQG